jgi:lipid-A-disaccharide synthase-like uncharacterized protein
VNKSIFANINNYWLAVGLIGQFFFTMRFLVQWVYSEKRKESLVPVSFWVFSLLGSLTLLTYAIYRHDPVFILGQSFGFLIYSRNLHLIHKHKKIMSEEKKAISSET